MKSHVVLASAAALMAGLGLLTANAGAANLPPPSGNPITATIDGGPNLGGDTWYQIGTNTAAPTTGIPVGGTVFTSKADPTISYMMPAYTGNDAVLLYGDATSGSQSLTQTIKFATPVLASNLVFLTSSGNGLGKLAVTANFTNGTSSLLGTIASPDWFGNKPVAVVANGRVSYNATKPNNQSFDNVNSGNPNLYDSVAYTGTTLNSAPGIATGDALDTISSVTVDVSGTGALANKNTHPAIFAVSSSLDGINYTPVILDPSSFNQSVVVTVPEPASLGLLSAGALGLIARRRRA